MMSEKLNSNMRNWILMCLYWNKVYQFTRNNQTILQVLQKHFINHVHLLSRSNFARKCSARKLVRESLKADSSSCISFISNEKTFHILHILLKKIVFIGIHFLCNMGSSYGEVVLVPVYRLELKIIFKINTILVL